MTEYVYVSSGKLKQWPEAARVEVDRLDDFSKLDLVMPTLSSSSRYCESPTAERLETGYWFKFRCNMQYGFVHRDSGPSRVSSEVIFFVGSAPESEPVVDIMLGGWAGHFLEGSEQSSSTRMGSRTEHLYDLWKEVARADEIGDFRIPVEYTRLPRETSPGDYLTLNEVSRWAYDVMRMSLETSARLQGVARVLTVITNNDREHRLLLATPLFVAHCEASDELPLGDGVGSGDPPPSRRSRWLRPRAEGESSRPA